MVAITVVVVAAFVAWTLLTGTPAEEGTGTASAASKATDGKTPADAAATGN